MKRNPRTAQPPRDVLKCEVIESDLAQTVCGKPEGCAIYKSIRRTYGARCTYAKVESYQITATIDGWTRDYAMTKEGSMVIMLIDGAQVIDPRYAKLKFEQTGAARRAEVRVQKEAPILLGFDTPVERPYYDPEAVSPVDVGIAETLLADFGASHVLTPAECTTVVETLTAPAPSIPTAAKAVDGEQRQAGIRVARAKRKDAGRYDAPLAKGKQLQKSMRWRTAVAAGDLYKELHPEEFQAAAD